MIVFIFILLSFAICAFCHRRIRSFVFACLTGTLVSAALIPVFGLVFGVRDGLDVIAAIVGALYALPISIIVGFAMRALSAKRSDRKSRPRLP